MTPNPWPVLTGAITPPPWRGESQVHRLPDDEEAEEPQPLDPSVISRPLNESKEEPA